MLVVLAGPSGTGKSTLLARAFAADPRLSFSVSHTTRPPRAGEVDGQAYHFVDEATFDHMIEVNAFAEWAHVHSRRYGTSKAEVQRLRDADRDIVFDVDVQGAAALTAAYPEAVSVFILPPSFASLEARLRGRGTEGEAQLAVRLANARREIAEANTFTYTIVNDDVATAAAALVAIIRAERLRTSRRPDLASRVLAGDDLSQPGKTNE
ncbi:MAG: guanylate kinase [Deltaproteobacteria bacterium]|nr:guanylate kinase [Deltaproteobacteria bacterium]